MEYKEKILAEIERLKNQEIEFMEHQGYTDFHTGLRDAYSTALDFINSLPEEPVSIPKDELQTWLKKQFKVSEKVMVRAERDWDRAYNNGEMTAYNNVINKVDSYDRQRKDIRLRY